MNVYEARHAGRTYCNDTEGSEHYKGGVEPLDLLIAKGLIEDFCIGNMIKYSTKFKITRNLADLRKVSDYSQILCGVELSKQTTAEPIVPKVSWISQEEYEQFFEDEQGMCGATDVAKGEPSKYEGWSDYELREGVCASVDGNCSDCPISSIALGVHKACGCNVYAEQHPAEFRKIAIERLDKEGKA